MRAMARRLSRSASIRSMAALSSAGTGPFRGAATNRRPHPRQRKLGTPEWVRPLRTTCGSEQRGHGGGGASCIRSGYKRATHEATTRGKRSEDLKAARAWLELAAKQGHAKAKAALSELK